MKNGALVPLVPNFLIFVTGPHWFIITALPSSPLKTQAFYLSTQLIVLLIQRSFCLLYLSIVMFPLMNELMILTSVYNSQH